MSETEGSTDHVTIETVPPPPPEVSQSTISNWLTAQALDNLSENNRSVLVVENKKDNIIKFIQ